MTSAIAGHRVAPTRPSGHSPTRSRTDGSRLQDFVSELLNRHAAVGLAIGVVRDGRLQDFAGRGFSDLAGRTPISEDTVFRIGSITKTFTAIVVLQLWERGLVDLDAPAGRYLKAFELVPARSEWRPATIRHLLTHTAGIPEVVYLDDLLRPEWGPFEGRPVHYSVPVGDPMPSLADYYRGHLRIVAEPGTNFAYTNHGFAALGQIVEDVTGEPLERYLREHVLGPLGLADTDLVRSERLAARLATGYTLGPSGPTAVPDRDWIGVAGGGIYSTTRDLARFVAALLGGGANQFGRVLAPSTVAMMFEPQFQPDPRLPGVGLGVFRHELNGHRLVSHDGILPGFNTEFLVAPDDGIGVLGMTNGSTGAFRWLGTELGQLMRRSLGVPGDVVRTDIPQRPEIWGELCGRYGLPPRISDLRGRLATGGGAEVYVHGGKLMARLLTPLPGLSRGMALEPADEQDPYVFRLDLSAFGMSTVPVVFARDGGVVMSVHLDLGGQPMRLDRRPAGRSSGVSRIAPLAALAIAGAFVVRRRRDRPIERAEGSVHR